MRAGVALHAAASSPAAGLATRAELLAAYERHGGVGVDPEALAWWELAGTLRWGVICVMQAFSHLSGARRSVEHAVIGRRACEVEWDLLELLGVPLAGELAPMPPATPAAAPAVALHDRPTALELLHASREALGDDVLPQLQGRAAFQLRVVLRALGIVGRELEHSAEHAALHAAALASVGCRDERELALAIREQRARRARSAGAGGGPRHRAREARGGQPHVSQHRPNQRRRSDERRAAATDDGPDRGDRRLHRAGGQTARSAGRQRALLRPPPRALAHGLTRTAGSRAASGRTCSSRWSGAPTAPACGASRCPPSSAAARARTSSWRSCASTSTGSASASTTTPRARSR